jgi:hypothetical protein
MRRRPRCPADNQIACIVKDLDAPIQYSDMECMETIHESMILIVFIVIVVRPISVEVQLGAIEVRDFDRV